MNEAIAIGRIVHFVLPNGYHRPAWVIDAEDRAGVLLEVHPAPGEGTGYAEAVPDLPIFYTRAVEGHGFRQWHFHGNCKGGRYSEPDPPVLMVDPHAPPHLRWSDATMAGGEERLELVHIPGECANCDALR